MPFLSHLLNIIRDIDRNSLVACQLIIIIGYCCLFFIYIPCHILVIDIQPYLWDVCAVLRLSQFPLTLSISVSFINTWTGAWFWHWQPLPNWLASLSTQLLFSFLVRAEVVSRVFQLIKPNWIGKISMCKKIVNSNIVFVMYCVLTHFPIVCQFSNMISCVGLIISNWIDIFRLHVSNIANVESHGTGFIASSNNTRP